MLHLIIGKAAGGKTASIMNEIKSAVENRQGGVILLVPEQYSHEAERELSAVCGPKLSLYAEVLSFTGLARKISSQVGGVSVPYLDGAGKLLCMRLACSRCRDRLLYYAPVISLPETGGSLVKASDELKLRCISPEMLSKASGMTSGPLSRKLSDLSLLMSAYNAAVSSGHADPGDMLSGLAGRIPESSIGAGTRVYADGFTDFTAAEMKVLKAILDSGAELTVCLNLDGIDGGSEVFAIQRLSARRLLALSDSHTIEVLDSGVPGFADMLFNYGADPETKPAGKAEVWRCGGISAECELAAQRIMELTGQGCRYRDIAIAVRGFDDYRDSLESTLDRFGIPMLSARKSSMSSKSVAALISFAYDIILKGWNSDDVLSYLGTGLTGMDFADRDLLCAYVFRWQMNEKLWLAKEDWRQHPDGYDCEYTAADERRLAKINALRRGCAEPLIRLRKASRGAATVSEQAKALYAFLEDIKLASTLEKRSRALSEKGNDALADEYTRLWEIIVSALEQADSVLGDTPADTGEFAKLFSLMMSCYEVGSIPATVDAVAAGDFDRMRKRRIRHLIVLGASADRLPAPADGDGLFSWDEIETLDGIGIPELQLRESGESELWREFSLIYSCVSLPSEKMIIAYTDCDAGRSILASRAMELYGISEQTFDDSAFRAAEIASVRESDPEAFGSAAEMTERPRGSLSTEGVAALYGDSLKISAGRTDSFYSCKYRYFCGYGLRAQPWKPSAFSARETGIYLHYVLEKTAGEVKERGGFSGVSNEELTEMTRKYTSMYVTDELEGFREKSPRFIYLFNRMASDAENIVLDTAEELRRSSFEPLEFELDFGNEDRFPPMQIGESGDMLKMSGVADRVDIWEDGGKRYLRIADYKTGKKKFSLSEIWYGRSMQMLMYLSALRMAGDENTVPAGAMYVPARDEFVSADSADAPGIDRKRADSKKRSGIMLNSGGIKEAWSSDSMKLTEISEDQSELLRTHVMNRLSGMASQIREGKIEADPYYEDENNTACTYCDFRECCGFMDGERGESCRELDKLKDDEVWDKMQEDGNV